MLQAASVPAGVLSGRKRQAGLGPAPDLSGQKQDFSPGLFSSSCQKRAKVSSRIFDVFIKAWQVAVGHKSLLGV